MIEQPREDDYKQDGRVLFSDIDIPTMGEINAEANNTNDALIDESNISLLRGYDSLDHSKLDLVPLSNRKNACKDVQIFAMSREIPNVYFCQYYDYNSKRLCKTPLRSLSVKKRSGSCRKHLKTVHGVDQEIDDDFITSHLNPELLPKYLRSLRKNHIIEDTIIKRERVAKERDYIASCLVGMVISYDLSFGFVDNKFLKDLILKAYPDWKDISFSRKVRQEVMRIGKELEDSINGSIRDLEIRRREFSNQTLNTTTSDTTAPAPAPAASDHNNNNDNNKNHENNTSNDITLDTPQIQFQPPLITEEQETDGQFQFSTNANINMLMSSYNSHVNNKEINDDDDDNNNNITNGINNNNNSRMIMNPIENFVELSNIIRVNPDTNLIELDEENLRRHIDLVKGQFRQSLSDEISRYMVLIKLVMKEFKDFDIKEPSLRLF